MSISRAAPLRSGSSNVALALDPVARRPVERQRMSPPRLVVAPLEFRGRALEEQDLRVRSPAAASRATIARMRSGSKSRALAPIPSANGRGARRSPVRRRRRQQPVEQGQGQVVDRLPAQILQRLAAPSTDAGARHVR